eukprot:CAMPEP_0197908158 /NCGR_PEP_ID=MMETSP1439-20131203/66257_1 /TAXON_ID=66791 /ORGANISM="Gonyaulax spinifera, Strain CCMP409" /LENGTH=186 /DNA_ID=CAMNT_0043529629 /DNA_START=71 /DNA_END=631 /DNA_ORIENTATION=+
MACPATAQRRDLRQPRRGAALLAVAALLAGALALATALPATFVQVSFGGQGVRGASGATSLRSMEGDWPAPDSRRVGGPGVGGPMVLTEENVELVLRGAREDLGNIFGYQQESREAGITGGVEFVEIEGPVVILAFTGEFWHRRVDVLQRLMNYMVERIPEIAEVDVSDPEMLVDRKDKNIYHNKS